MRYRVLAVLAIAVVVGLMTAEDADAITIRIGDADGFGFSPTTGLVRATGSPHTTPADTNGDGVLTAGEYLPDLNKNGSVDSGSNDTFDNRSVIEIGSTNGAQSTDRSLEPAPTAHNRTFTFTFTAPSLGDPDFGVDHLLDLVFGD